MTQLDWNNGRNIKYIFNTLNPKKPRVLKDLYSPGGGLSGQPPIKVSNPIHILMCDT